MKLHSAGLGNAGYRIKIMIKNRTFFFSGINEEGYVFFQ